MLYTERITLLPKLDPRRILFEARQEISNPKAIIQEVTRHVQNMLDNFARTRGYDNIVSASSYANSTVAQFAAEAARCITLRDQCWATCYTIMEDVKAGKRPMPTVEQIIDELPQLTWS